MTADLLIGGIDLYRGLPNPAFESQVRILRNLLEAGPAVGAEEWNALKAKLQDKTQPLLHSHLPELWAHILGKTYGDRHRSTGPESFTVRPRR